MCKKITTSLCIALFCFSQNLFAADYYVDPQRGSNSNSGSKASPWKTLAEVFKSRKRFNGGDTIHLYRGYHGAPTITGINSRDVYIRAVPGHSPAVRNLVFMNAHHWYIKGLTVSTFTTPKNHPDMGTKGSGILIDDQRNENSHHNTIEKCSLYTEPDSSHFTATDWGNKKAGIQVYGNYNKLIGNHLYNGGGIQIGYHSNHTLIRGNVVENIGTDAFGMRGNYCIVEQNLFMNSYKVNGNHNDLFQGWGSKGNIVRNNELRAYTDPNRKYITNTQPYGGASQTQGIGLFDGLFKDWVIENNLIRVDHTIGIWALGAEGFTIRNNKIVRCGKKIWRVRKNSAPGIHVGAGKSGRAAKNCVVVNNVAENFMISPKYNKNRSIGQTSNNTISTNYTPPADSSPPSKPAKLSATTIPGYGTDLLWTPSSDNKKVMGYHIYHNGIKIGKARTGTQYLAVRRFGGSFQVQAFDYRGNVSAKSNAQGSHNISVVQINEPTPEPELPPAAVSIASKPVTTPPPPPPPAPKPPKPVTTSQKGAQDLSGIRTGKTTIALSWKAPPGNPILKEYGIVLGASDRNWKRVATVDGKTLNFVLTSAHRIKSSTAQLQVRAILNNGNKLDMSQQIQVLPYTAAPVTTTRSIPATPPAEPEPRPDSTTATSNAMVLQAENAHVVGAKRFKYHVDYINRSNDYIEWSVNCKEEVLCQLDFKYALVAGNRPLEISVNGNIVSKSLSFPSTGSWNRYKTSSVKARLKAGLNKIRATAIGYSGGNLDHLSIKSLDDTGSPSPSTAKPTRPVTRPAPEPSPDPVTNTVITYQAEKAFLSGVKAKSSYADYINNSNDYIEWTVEGNGGQARLDFRYALSYGDRPLEISVNGVVVKSSMSFPSTRSWRLYKTESLTVNLKPGQNKIKARAIGKSGGNFDALTVHPL